MVLNGSEKAENSGGGSHTKHSYQHHLTHEFLSDLENKIGTGQKGKGQNGNNKYHIHTAKNPEKKPVLLSKMRTSLSK